MRLVFLDLSRRARAGPNPQSRASYHIIQKGNKGFSISAPVGQFERHQVDFDRLGFVFVFLFVFVFILGIRVVLFLLVLLLVVGLFVLAGFSALAYLSVSLGGTTYRGPGGLEIHATFDQIAGLGEVFAPLRS